MKVLVFGGAGYIGSHVCKELAKEGHIPITYDNLSTGHKWAVKWGDFELGNILDTDRVQSILEKHNPEIVIHLAACAYIGESIINPAKYYSNNIIGSLSLLNAMKNTNVRKIIFSSSCATYGIPDKIPITEDQIQNPINPYGNSKLFIEKIIKDYVSAYGFQSVCLRYFNAAGADPEGKIGEEHYPETHIIPLVCQVALGKLECVNIFGDDYATKDGTCIRDYTHVSDIALAHIKTMDYMNTFNQTYDCLNIGIGNGYSIKDIISAVKKISKKKIPIYISKRRKGDPPILICDTTRAELKLNWYPKYNQLEDIIQHAWNFYIKSI